MKHKGLWIFFIILLVLLVIGIVIWILIFDKKSPSKSNGHSNGGGNGGGNGSSNNNLPPQTTTLRFINNCSYDLMLEGRTGVVTQAGNPNDQPAGIPEPLPGYTTPNLLSSGGYFDYEISSSGLAATRFWPKYGCVSGVCQTGDSDPFWPQGGCPSGVGCSPPADSLFEATWGCSLPNSSSCSFLNPNANNTSTSARVSQTTTYFDTSAVNGFTLPFTVQMSGSSSGACDVQLIDATQLNVANCPISNIGLETSTDLTWYNNAETIGLGCFSPCTYLTYPQPYGLGLPLSNSSTTSPQAQYCCPTPPFTSSSCRAGPVSSTAYTNYIHTATGSNVYAFSYDDAHGLHTCPSSNVKYTVTYCPIGSPAYPATFDN